MGDTNLGIQDPTSNKKETKNRVIPQDSIGWEGWRGEISENESGSIPPSNPQPLDPGYMRVLNQDKIEYTSQIGAQVITQVAERKDHIKESIDSVLISIDPVGKMTFNTPEPVVNTNSLEQSVKITTASVVDNLKQPETNPVLGAVVDKLSMALDGKVLGKAADATKNTVKDATEAVTSIITDYILPPKATKETPQDPEKAKEEQRIKKINQELQQRYGVIQTETAAVMQARQREDNREQVRVLGEVGQAGTSNEEKNTHLGENRNVNYEDIDSDYHRNALNTEVKEEKAQQVIDESSPFGIAQNRIGQMTDQLRLDKVSEGGMLSATGGVGAG